MPLSDTDLTLYGFGHLVGKTVAAEVGGVDCGDYTVAADGSITVPFGSDAGGLMTAAYLAGLDGYTGEQAAEVTFYLNGTQSTYVVPIVVGPTYTSQGQTLRPATQEDVRSPTGAALGKTRRGHRMAALLQNCVSGQIDFGTTFSNIVSATLPNSDGLTGVAATSTFSGVYRTELSDDYSFDAMLCWQVDRPVPATVCSLSTFLHAADE